MPLAPRAARLARKVLAEEGVRRPSVPVERIASKYTLIVREKMPDDISGMLVPLPSVRGKQSWVIVVNSTHASVRQRFTIAHELAHALLHRYTAPHADGRLQVKFRDSESSQGIDQEEIEANQFAAELLMPDKFVRDLTARITFDLADAGEDERAMAIMIRLAKRFEVSVQALSFRIANLSAMDII